MERLEPEKQLLLEQSYRAVEGSLSRVLDSDNIAHDLGWSGDRAHRLIVDCCREGLLKWVAGSGKQVAFRLSPLGLSYARRAAHQTPHARVSEAPGYTPPGEEYPYIHNATIFATGELLARGRNRVLVNGQELALGDRPLALLLELINAARVSAGGWADTDALGRAAVVPSEGDYRLLSELRKALAPLIGGPQADKIVEKKNREAAYRLSTPPASLSYARDKLLEHPNKKVREIAKQLKK